MAVGGEVRGAFCSARLAGWGGGVVPRLTFAFSSRSASSSGPSLAATSRLASASLFRIAFAASMAAVLRLA